MMRSENIVLLTLSHFIRNRAMAVGSCIMSMCSRYLTLVSKNVVWSSFFTSSVNNVLGL